MDAAVDTVLEFLRLLEDPETDPDAVAALLHPEVRMLEQPNLVTPRGRVHDRDSALSGLAAGRAAMSSQRYDVHDIRSCDDTVIVRATWEGTVAAAAGSMPAGSVIRAHFAAFFTVEEGQILEHVTYDCFEPLPGR